MQSVQKLQKEVNILKEKLGKRDSQLEQKTAYIKTLEATLIDFKKNRFGVKSEKSDPNQRQLFNEVELIADAKKVPKSKELILMPICSILQRDASTTRAFPGQLNSLKWALVKWIP